MYIKYYFCIYNVYNVYNFRLLLMLRARIYICQKRDRNVSDTYREYGHMVKLQKQKKGNYVVAMPKEFIAANGWNDDTQFTWCPCKNDSLRLVPLFKNKV
jgi:hypothetical protein